MKVLVMYKPDIYFEWLGADILETICYRKKKSSAMVTDLSENIIREFAFKNNLVDIKVCNVSK